MLFQVQQHEQCDTKCIGLGYTLWFSVFGLQCVDVK